MNYVAAILGLLALLAAPVQAAAQAKPLFETSAKSFSWGLSMPIPPLVKVVVGTLGPSGPRQLDDCVRSQGLQPRNYRGLLLSGAFSPSPGHRLHVVRASDKYCAAFYGPRDFVYYLVDERTGGPDRGFKLVLQNRGDRMAVLPKVTNGLNDIEAAGCNERGCRIARLAFDGRRYRAVQCEESEIRGKRETRRPRACGSDAFRDDQAVDPAPRPRR